MLCIMEIYAVHFSGSLYFNRDYSYQKMLTGGTYYEGCCYEESEGVCMVFPSYFRYKEKSIVKKGNSCEIITAVQFDAHFFCSCFCIFQQKFPPVIPFQDYDLFRCFLRLDIRLSYNKFCKTDIFDKSKEGETSISCDSSGENIFPCAVISGNDHILTVYFCVPGGDGKSRRHGIQSSHRS